MRLFTPINSFTIIIFFGRGGQTLLKKRVWSRVRVSTSWFRHWDGLSLNEIINRSALLSDKVQRAIYSSTLITQSANSYHGGRNWVRQHCHNSIRLRKPHYNDDERGWNGKGWVNSPQTSWVENSPANTNILLYYSYQFKLTYRFSQHEVFKSAHDYSIDTVSGLTRRSATCNCE